MKKERLFWLDFIRAFATLVIVLTHYNAIYYYNVYPPTPEKAVITMNVANIYIGDFGVSLFLIISGASLMYVYGEKCDTLKFYKKRFLNIFPMFWMAYIFAFLYNYYQNGCIKQGVPLRNIIYSLLGIDTWIKNFSVQTFDYVADWFLGLIIIIYIVFPLLRLMINKHPVILAVIAIVMYILSVCTINRNVLLFSRLPEFLFGMYFMKYIRKVNWKWIIPAGAVILLNSIIKPEFNSIFQTTYIGICSFILLVWIADFIKANWFKSVCRKISKYSYACFIIHHMVIYMVIPRINIYTISVGQSYLLFGYVCIMVALATYILYNCHAKIVKMLKEPYN